MAAASKAVERNSLEGSTPSLSAFNKCPWPSGKGSSLPSWRGGFDSHRALLEIGDRLMVGHLSLNQEVKVQILLPELVGTSAFRITDAVGPVLVRAGGSEPS